jgi:hypothetical protein
MSLQSFLASATSTSGGAFAIALLLFVGGFEGLKALYRFASGVYVYTLRPGKNLKRLGQWAVVTGSTDGIGRAYADALARLGAALADLHPAISLVRHIKGFLLDGNACLLCCNLFFPGYARITTTRSALSYEPELPMIIISSFSCCASCGCGGRPQTPSPWTATELLLSTVH